MLGEKIVEHMKQFGQRPAIQINDTGDVYTFAQILQRVEYYRQQLILRQMPAGCVAAVSLENVVEYIAVLLALWQHDCIVVPMEECSAHALSQVQAKAGLDYLLCGEMRPGGAVLSESVYLIPQGGQAPNSTPAPIDAAVFLYTSGTTGLPKCVVFSHEAMYRNIADLAQSLNLAPSDVCYTPVSHLITSALTTIYLPGLISGATVVIKKTFLPGAMKNVINRYRVTVLFSVPFVYAKLLESPAIDQIEWDHVRLCLTSSSYMAPQHFVGLYEKSGKVLHSIYCSSECGVISYQASDDLTKAQSSVGHPVKGVDIKIVASDGVEVPHGICGEILVAGAHCASGYYNDDICHQRLISKQYPDYFHTGDFGCVTQEGIVLKGRISQTMNIAGHLVNPQEVEDRLILHPGLQDAAVFSLPDDDHNERIYAKVVAADRENPPDEEDVIRFCRDGMEDYKVPRKIIFVDEIDLTSTGKKIRKL